MRPHMFELFMFSALVVASASVSTDHGSDVVSRVFLTSCTIRVARLAVCSSAPNIAERFLCLQLYVSRLCHLVAAFGEKDAASEPRTADTISSIFFVGDAACVFFFALVLCGWRIMILRRRWQCLRQLAVSWALMTSAAQQIETLKMSLYVCC